MLAAAGSVTATVLTTFSPWPTSDVTMQPIYVTGLLTQLDGIRTATRVAARQTPDPSAGRTKQRRASESSRGQLRAVTAP
jgi:hypothetical protein